MTRAALVLCAAVLAPAGAAAQSAELTGQVVGPEGPVRELAVALHRVTPDGGANIDEVATDEQGVFQFTITFAADSAVYFAATRFDGELYVGPPIRGSVPAEPYVIRVGTGPAVRPQAGPPTGMVQSRQGPPPAQDNGAVLAVFLLIGVVVLAGVVFAMRHTLGGGPDRRRILLVELAEIEETLARGAADDPGRLEERRAELREQILTG